jgi:serine/threonine protein kinase
VERLGRYQILDKLGQGSMGTVYLARHTRLDRCVALKVLPPESVHDPDAVARFRCEARALARLGHPGIVQFYDSEEDNGRHFLVMEYVEGQSLAAVLKEKGRLPPTLAADSLHQALLAVQHAHEKGLVHRDLKPSNLLLTPDGKVKVLDLGLARFLQDQIGDPNRTHEGVGMGTPDYMAPEQFRNAHSVDARADVYSLGCTLYRLLAGQVPFPGSSLAEKRQAHCHQEPAPLQELCPEAPAGLVLVVRRMMAKQPGERFQMLDLLDVHVVGNRIWNASRTALQLEKVLADAANVLFANNTVFQSGQSFQLWDTAARGQDVQVRNNLFLAPKGPDMIFVDSGGNPLKPRGPGAGNSVAAVWKLDHNWREGQRPVGDAFSETAWIPPTAADVLREQIDGVRRSPADLERFLQPAKHSELATAGAGKTDPSLPVYVGALPPEGVPRWDWDKTWKARLAAAAGKD